MPSTRAAREAGDGRRSSRAVTLITSLWRRLARDFAGGYRPERHYMRGPGPEALERKSRPAG